MTVYVITEGSYSDYHIIAVATDKNKAEKLAKLFDAYVEEWETDTVRDRKVLDGFKRYQVSFDSAGDVYAAFDLTSCQDTGEGVYLDKRSWWEGESKTYTVKVVTWARNREEAIKIASEKRAQCLAEKEGIT